ncbi:MAG: type I-C CRISPR-associated protein Cas8c/Csd1 [Hominenteromicrobium sp.]
MILQALTAYYEKLAEKGEIAQPGWSSTKITYALQINDGGALLGVMDLRHEDKRGSKVVLVPDVMQVPEAVKRSVDIAPNFLWDNSTYMLGMDEKGKPERAKQCFEACRALHVTLLGDCPHPAARAVTAFFENWNPDTAAEHPALQACLPDLLKGANIVFRHCGQYVHEIPELRTVWQEHYARDEDAVLMPCLVTGRLAPTAKLHPNIKGVRDAQPMGASIVSFNAPAFTSYGKEQGFNAPVSKYAAFAYTTALNTLLADTNHVRLIGDMTVVCWAESGEKAYQDVWSSLMAAGDDAKLDDDVQKAVSAIARGLPCAWNHTVLKPDEHFYVLGLSPNAARLSVRLFYRDSFGAMMRCIQAHYKRMEIVKPAFEPFGLLPLWRLLAETVNPNARDKKAVPNMAGDLLRAVLTNTRYPATLYNGIQLRIRADRKVNYARAAAIKAYLIQNYKEDISVALDEQRNDAAYVLGRLFAVLEEIQEKANPGINTTIVDRYFSSAGSTPARVFPTLLQLAQKHMRRLDNARIYKKMIGDILDRLDGSFPAVLGLKESGDFEIGYYHQRQRRFTKKEDK